MTKPIQIRNEDVVRDIREAVALTQQSITEVVADGVRMVLDQARRRATKETREREIDRILAEVRALPQLGPPLTDDDLYDQDGLPK